LAVLFSSQVQTEKVGFAAPPFQKKVQ